MAKKTSNYSPNAALIQGAAVAYKNWDNVPGMYSGFDKAIKAGSAAIQIGTEEYIKQQEKQKAIEVAFDDAADKVLLEAGALGQNLYDSTYDELVDAKKIYLQGINEKDNKKRMEGLKYIQNHSAWVKDHKALKLNLANAQKEGLFSKYMYNKGSEDLLAITKILNSDYSKTSRNEQGDIVFHIEDSNGNERLVSSKEFENLATFKFFKTGEGYVNAVKSQKNKENFDAVEFGTYIKAGLPTNKKQWEAAMADGVFGGEGISNKTLATMLNDAFEDGKLDQYILNAIGAEGMSVFDDGDKTLSETEKNAFIKAAIDSEDNAFDLNVSNQILAEMLEVSGLKQFNKDQASKQQEQEEKNTEFNRRFRMQNKERKTFNVGYGVGYVTVDSAKQLEKDVKNRVKTITVKGRGTFILNEKDDVYELVGEKDKRTPVSNQYIFTTHGSWQEGYGRDIGEYGYKAPPTEDPNSKNVPKIIDKNPTVSSISPDINSNIFSAKSSVEVKDQLVALSKDKNYSFRQNASDRRANIIYVFDSNNPNKSLKLKFNLIGTDARDQMKKFNEFIAGIK
tara:strand:- start:1181 stop:2875 length:1695 start_codon:yes stop_codon:yes gene_type:complete